MSDSYLSALTAGVPAEFVTVITMGSPVRRIDWVKERREYLWPDVKLDWEEHKYLEAIYEDEHEYLVARKAAQVGLSEWAVTDAFWTCDTKNGNVLYVLPGTGDVQDFSTTRVGLAIEASPYIANIISPEIEIQGYSGKRADRTTLKRVRNRFFYLRHGSVRKDGRAPHLKVAQIDNVILDELDEIDPRAVALTDKRLGHSALKWQRRISTPSLPDWGIDLELQQSDWRQWLVKCKKCSTEQPLKPFTNLITAVDTSGRPVEWFHKRGKPHLPYVGCRKCGKPLDRLTGRWVAKHPGRDAHGYDFNKLMSPQVDLHQLIQAGMSFDETKRREWFNQDLGLPYQTAESGYDLTLLRSAEAPYRMPMSGKRCAMGVDVGAALNVVIRQYAPVFDNGVLAKTVMKAMFIGEVEHFADLDKLMRRYNVKWAVCDALPEERAAKAWAAEHKRRVRLAFYIGGETAAKRDEATTEKVNERFAIELNRTRWFDMMKANYELGEIQNPASLESRVPDYYKHLMAINRVIEEDKKGKQIARWVKTSADHYAHAELYCQAAMEMMGPLMEGDGATFESGDGDGRKRTVSDDGENVAGWEHDEDGERKSAWQ